MALIKFTRNYNDHSTDSGFQFEFFCDRCGSGYESTFQGSASSTVTNVLDVASGLFGGLLGNVADAGHRVHSTAWEKQHDQEFQKAVEEVKPFLRTVNVVLNGLMKAAGIPPAVCASIVPLT